MATNLAIDDRLIEEARRIGKHKTKKAAVAEALEEYIQRHKQDGKGDGKGDGFIFCLAVIWFAV